MLHLSAIWWGDARAGALESRALPGNLPESGNFFRACSPECGGSDTRTPNRPGLGRDTTSTADRAASRYATCNPPEPDRAAPTLCPPPPLPPPCSVSWIRAHPGGKEKKSPKRPTPPARLSAHGLPRSAHPLLHSLPHLPAHRFLRFLPCPPARKLQHQPASLKPALLPRPLQVARKAG